METNESTTEGVTGAPAEPEAVDSQLVEEALKSLDKPEPSASAPAGLDAEFVKKLETVDPGALPESLRRKFESPFLSQYNKKTTEWDNERQRYLSMIEKLSNRPTGAQEPPPDQQELLRQKIAEGDLSALEPLVQNLVEQRVGPQTRELAMNNAIQGSVRLFPEGAKYEQEVASVLRDNPGVAYTIYNASVRDQALGAQLLAGLAKNIAYDRMAQEYASMPEKIKAGVAAGIKAVQDRLKGLPASTSKAGTTPSKTVTEEFDRNRIRDEAWAEAGGS